MTLNYTPKLGGWLPDSTMPDASSHIDLNFADVSSSISKYGSSIKNPAIPTSAGIDLRKWCSPIEDQGQIGSCVGNSVVGALEFLENREGKQFVELSRLFVYYNARLMGKNVDEDSGTYIRLAMGTLSSLGTCSEEKWSYDTSEVFTRPSWGAYREAYAHKIAAFYSIVDGSHDAIKEALLAQHVVVFGMVVDKEYENYRGGIVAMPKATRLNPGAHAQCIVGFNDSTQTYIIRNSWGTGWGENGYAYVPYKYLTESSASDFWVPVISSL